MMLKSWSIENFKPIVNSGELKLAPVTVLAGRNSSGKSSLLQSILMIAQTLSNQLPERALLPNGPLVQLGTFEDILSDFSDLRTLMVSFELVTEDALIKNYDDYELPLEPSVKSIKAATTFQSLKQSGEVFSAMEASRVWVENGSIEVITTIGNKDVSLYDNFNLNLIYRKTNEKTLYRILKETAPERQHSTELPAYLTYTGELKTTDKKFSEAYLLTLSHFLPNRFIEELEAEDKRRRRFSPILLTMSHNKQTYFLSAVEQITRFFTSKIRYLGPLRADPSTAQRAFSPTSELDEVGAKGEYASVVYHHNQLESITWYNPHTKQVEHGTLQDALDIWTQYLGIAEQVRTEMAGSIGVAWKIVHKKGQKARTLPEVGGGVNHVLPILVMGLLAPAKALLIVEEPEVTLHARVQARLGDFMWECLNVTNNA